MPSKELVSTSSRLSSERSIAQGLWYWGPVGIYAGVIFYFSSLSFMPEQVSSLVEELSDKFLHFCEYAVLGALMYRACRHAGGPRLSRSALTWAIAVSVLYGFSDELHQYFVPLREADGLDLVADAFGAAFGAWIWHLVARP